LESAPRGYSQRHDGDRQRCADSHVSFCRSPRWNHYLLRSPFRKSRSLWPPQLHCRAYGSTTPAHPSRTPSTPNGSGLQLLAVERRVLRRGPVRFRKSMVFDGRDPRGSAGSLLSNAELRIYPRPAVERILHS
jgi:hypothetical protein